MLSKRSMFGGPLIAFAFAAAAFMSSHVAADPSALRVERDR